MSLRPGSAWKQNPEQPQSSLRQSIGQWPGSVAPLSWPTVRSAMPTHIMTAFPVMGGDPMLTSGAAVTGHTWRRWHFCHRRWWHIRWRRRSRRHLRRGWRWCGLLLRARGQADDRQSDKCVENRGFHDDQSLTSRNSGSVVALIQPPSHLRPG
jgi:hypothetical protein